MANRVLTAAELAQLETYVLAENPIGYYTYLGGLGDRYGWLALDVVNDNTLSGSVARAFAESFATEAVNWPQVSLRLMQEDFAQRQALTTAGQPALELSVATVRDYHSLVFQEFGLPPEAWTAYAPTVLAGPAGEAAVWDSFLERDWLDQAFWGGTSALSQVIFDALSDDFSSLPDSTATPIARHILTLESLSDPEVRNNLADLWLSHLVGLENVWNTAMAALFGNDLRSYRHQKTDGGFMVGGDNEADELFGSGQADLVMGYRGADVIDDLAGDDYVYAGKGDDVIKGSGGVDVLHGGEADRSQWSGDGFDTVDYSAIANPITIEFGNLNSLETAAPTVIDDGLGGQDYLLSIEQIIGTDHSDTVRLDRLDPAQLEWFGHIDLGLHGSGPGDKLDASAFTAGLTVQLADPNAQRIFRKDNEFTWLAFKSAEIVTTGSGNDDLFGGSGSETLDGGAGNDTLVGGGGDDVLIGGQGTDVLNGGGGPGADGLDTADYSLDPMGILVQSTAAGFDVTDGWGTTDTLSSIEKIIGSAHDDTFKISSVSDWSGELILDGGAGSANSLDLSALDPGAILLYAKGAGDSGQIEVRQDAGTAQIDFANLQQVTLPEGVSSAIDPGVLATYAGLAEIVYRRDPMDQPLTIADIQKVTGGTLAFVAPDTPIAVTGPGGEHLDYLKVDGNYYYSERGFGGAIVEFDGKHLVVLRGTDSTVSGWSSAFANIGKNQLGIGGDNPIADPQFLDTQDGLTNGELGFGTYEATQWDDTLALTQRAIDLYGKGNVVVVGQSLGGGLAGLASAVLGVEGFVIAPAPFENQLAVQAKIDAALVILTTHAEKFTTDFLNSGIEFKVSVLQRISESPAIDVHLKPEHQASGGLIQNEYLSTVQTLKAEYENNLAKLTSHLIEGEALSNTETIMGKAFYLFSDQFKDPDKTYDVGEGGDAQTASELKHGPSLHALVLRTEPKRPDGSDQSFAKLLREDEELRRAFLETTEIVGAASHGREGPSDDPSKLVDSGADSMIMLRALWKTVGEDKGLYAYLHKLFGETAKGGAAGDGINTWYTADEPSIHSGVVTLALGVLRSALQGTSDVQQVMANLAANQVGVSVAETVNFAGGSAGEPLTDQIVVELGAIKDVDQEVKVVERLTIEWVEEPAEGETKLKVGAVVKDEKIYQDESGRPLGVNDIDVVLWDAIQAAIGATGPTAEEHTNWILEAYGTARKDLYEGDRQVVEPGRALGALELSRDDLLQGSKHLGNWQVLVVQAGLDVALGKADHRWQPSADLAAKNHMLILGSGNDFVTSGGGDDYILGRSGTNDIDGGGGHDFIVGAEGADTLSGGAGDDVLLGGGGEDNLFGGADKDTLHGGAGKDHLDGGTGIDTASYISNSHRIVVTPGAEGAFTVVDDPGPPSVADTLVSIERIIGSMFGDEFTGGGGKDTFLGLGGIDVIDGGGEEDTAEYSLDLTGIYVQGTGVSSYSVRDGWGFTDTLTSIERIIGSRHADLMEGGVDRDIFDGGAGNDKLYGGAENDTLIGGAGVNVLHGGILDDPGTDILGYDVADYSNAPNAIAVAIHDSTRIGVLNGWFKDNGLPDKDALSSIEGVVGSDHDDVFRLGDFSQGPSQILLDGGGGVNTLDISYLKWIPGLTVVEHLHNGDGSGHIIVERAGNQNRIDYANMDVLEDGDLLPTFQLASLDLVMPKIVVDLLDITDINIELDFRAALEADFLNFNFLDFADFGFLSDLDFDLPDFTLPDDFFSLDLPDLADLSLSFPDIDLEGLLADIADFSLPDFEVDFESLLASIFADIEISFPDRLEAVDRAILDGLALAQEYLPGEAAERAVKAIGLEGDGAKAAEKAIEAATGALLEQLGGQVAIDILQADYAIDRKYFGLGYGEPPAGGGPPPVVRPDFGDSLVRAGVGALGPILGGMASAQLLDLFGSDDPGLVQAIETFGDELGVELTASITALAEGEGFLAVTADRLLPLTADHAVTIAGKGLAVELVDRLGLTSDDGSGDLASRLGTEAITSVAAALTEQIGARIATTLYPSYAIANGSFRIVADPADPTGKTPLAPNLGSSLVSSGFGQLGITLGEMATAQLLELFGNDDPELTLSITTFGEQLGTQLRASLEALAEGGDFLTLTAEQVLPLASDAAFTIAGQALALDLAKRLGFTNDPDAEPGSAEALASQLGADAIAVVAKTVSEQIGARIAAELYPEYAIANGSFGVTESPGAPGTAVVPGVGESLVRSGVGSLGAVLGEMVKSVLRQELSVGGPLEPAVEQIIDELGNLIGGTFSDVLVDLAEGKGLPDLSGLFDLDMRTMVDSVLDDLEDEIAPALEFAAGLGQAAIVDLLDIDSKKVREGVSVVTGAVLEQIGASIAYASFPAFAAEHELFGITTEGAVVTLPNFFGSLIAAGAGGVFGALIAEELFGSDNQFVELGAELFVNAVAGNLASLIDANPIEDLLNLFEGRDAGVDVILDEATWDLGSGAQIGAGQLSALLTAELISLIGLDNLDGFAGLGADVLNSTLSTVITNVIEVGPSVLAGTAEVSQLLQGVNLTALGGAVGGVLGNFLASEIVQFDTVFGQIGSQIGGTLGALAGALVGQVLIPVPFLGAFVGAFIGSFLGNMLGGLIGDALADPPEAGATLVFDAASGVYYLQDVDADNGGSKELAEQLGQGSIDSVNFVLRALGGEVQNAALPSVEVGHKEDELFVKGPGGTEWFEMGRDDEDQAIAASQKVFDHAALAMLGDVKIAGGDILGKRAFYASLDSLIGADGKPINGALQALFGNLSTAASYAAYRQNAAVINGLIAANPNSAFAAGWIITLLRAEELGLQRRHDMDWYEGWRFFLDDNEATALQLTLAYEADGREFLFFEGTPEEKVIEDYVAPDGKATLTGSQGSDRIVVDGDTVNGSVSAAPVGQDLDLGGEALQGRQAQIYSAAVLKGGAGHDVIVGGDLGNDLFGGAGNDHLLGGALDDWLFGGAGDDYLLDTGGEGNALFGEAGNDLLRGAGASDWLQGGAGDDSLFGGAGADILEGGAGRDRLDGGAGGDTYIFRAGEGEAVIADGGSGDLDRLLLDGALAAADATVLMSANSEDVLIHFASTDDVIRLVGQALASETGIEEVVLPDGTLWNRSDLVSLMESGKFGDSFIGTSAADDLAGTLKDDDLAGGAGDDTLTGGYGSDSYSFNSGDGHDSVADLGGEGDFDRLSLGPGIATADVTVSRSLTDRDDVVLTIGGAGDVVTLVDQDRSDAHGVDEVRFEDGTVWSASDLARLYLTQASTSGGDTIVGFRADEAINGGGGNDVIAGGRGDDVLDGGTGSDDYHFDLGDGRDRINEGDHAADVDRLVFGDGITAADIQVTRDFRDGSDAILSIPGSDDRIYLDNQFGAAGRGVEQIVFADGTVWTDADLMQLYLQQAASTRDDSFSGFGGDDAMAGGLGHDILRGGGGSDTYTFNPGDGQDWIHDSGSAADVDRLVFGAGIAPGEIRLLRDSQDLNDLILEIVGSGDRVQLADQFDQAHEGVEQVVFQDGTVWSASDLKALYIAQAQTAANDRIDGFAEADVLDGGAGGDVIVTYGGDDSLTGGVGNDRLYGGAGSDSYTFNLGDGHDWIFDDGNAADVDRLVFGTGITTGDIEVVRGWSEIGDLFLRIGTTGDVIRVDQQFGADSKGLEEIVFHDGTVWTESDLKALYLSQSETARSGVIQGFDDGETISGGGGDDRIFGRGGDDTLIGGTGNDWLEGGGGSDSYMISLGEGYDWIYDNGSTADVDRLMLGPGITTADVVVTASGSDSKDVILRIAGSHLVYIGEQFDAASEGLEEIVFDDGTIWTEADLLALMQPVSVHNGTGGADVFDFDNPGADYMHGGSKGSDDYHYDLGDGHDQIYDGQGNAANTDELFFGPGITASDVNITRVGARVLFTFDGHPDDSLLIVNQADYEGIERVVFDDGTVWNKADIRQAYLSRVSTDGDDTITGTNSGQRDDIRGGLGDDLLEGGTGSDYYYFDLGDGHDRIIEGNSGDVDRLVFGAGISPQDIIITHTDGGRLLEIAGHPGDSVHLVIQGDFEGVEWVVFHDGTVWDKADLQQAYHDQTATDGDDRIFGSHYRSADSFRGGAGNDVLVGGTGSDTYYFDLGDGHDQILEEQNHTSDVDKLVFGAGIDPGDLIITYIGGGHLISFAGQPDSSVFIIGPGDFEGIERFHFEDGTVWNKADFHRAYQDQHATGGNDVIGGSWNRASDQTDAGPGDDILTNSHGSDTYHFDLGDGHDEISEDTGSASNVDRVVFGAGIRPEDLIVSKPGGGDVLVQIAGTRDSLLLHSQTSSYKGVERFVFADGTELTSGTVFARISTRSGENDVLFGSSLDEVLDTGIGDDTLTGSLGQDVLRGGLGSDTYNFALGDGRDTIQDASGSGDVDRLVFGAGIAPEDILVLLSPSDSSDLILTLRGTDDAVYLDGQKIGRGVEEVVFDDGTIWIPTDLVPVDSQTQGGAAADTIDGTVFDDILVGGLGSDLLRGGYGSDTYRFDLGDGQDTITDEGAATDTDRLELGAGITTAQVSISRSLTDGEDLILEIGAGTDSIYLDYDAEGRRGIEEVAFDDGTVWSATDLRQSYLSSLASDLDDPILGFSGDDVIAGGAGNDTLDGAEGSDSYHFGLGDGVDRISDTGGQGIDRLVLGTSILASDIRVSRSASFQQGWLLMIIGTAAAIEFGGIAGVGLEQIEFEDGTVWTMSDVAQTYLAQAVTDGNDIVEGTLDGDTIDGGAGDDVIYGVAGNNSLFGGDGNDRLHGGTGDDQLFGGAGDDILAGDYGLDSFDGGAGFDFVDFSHSAALWTVDLAAGTASPGSTTETLVGIEGVYGGLRNDHLLGDANDNTLDGGQGDDMLEGRAGNDTLIGGEGDDKLFGNGDDDRLIGGTGADVIDGGLGVDTVSYAQSDLAVAADLALGLADQIVPSIVGRYLRVQLVEGDYLSLAEVEVYAGGANVAVNGTAEQITTGWGGVASRAIDGNRDGEYDNGSVTHTNGGPQAWWQVDLGDVFDIHGIQLFNRTDGFTDRLSNFSVFVSERAFLAEETYADLQQAADVREIFFPRKVGTDWLLYGAELSPIVHQDSLSAVENVEGSDFDDELLGDLAANQILGFAGDDVIEGRAGDDSLGGGLGDDVFRYALGDGNDVITEVIGEGGADRLVFGAGIAAEGVSYAAGATVFDLVLTLPDAAQITLIGQFDGDHTAVETIEFADGTVWSTLDLYDEISNVAPTVDQGVPAAAGVEDSPFSYTLPANAFTDSNPRDQLTFSARLSSGEALPAWLAFDGTTFTGTPLNEAVGSHEIEVIATDRFGATTSTTFTLTVANTNDAPVVATPIARVEAEADSLLSYAVPAETFVDIDPGDTLTLTASLTNGDPLPAWMTFDGQTFGGTPAAGDVAILMIRLTATDSAGETVFTDFQLDVVPAGGVPAINGTAGNDVLDGTAFSEVLAGGLGSDQLTGGKGDDVYVFAPGDGEDTIINAAGGPPSDFDTLQFGAGILPGDVVLAFNGRDAEITFTSAPADKVTLKDFAGVEELDRILFNDGTAWSAAEIWSRLLPGRDGPDTLIGTNAGELLYGGADNDTLEGGQGQDTLIGATGDDTMKGGWHPDTYVYKLGDGNDVIEEYASSTTGDRETGNRLELGAGITTANLLVTRDATDWSQVTLGFQGHAGSIFLKNQFLNSQWGVETIVFADGTTWNMAQLAAAGLAQLTTDGDDYLFGHKGVDTIDGGAGNDQIFGWEGRDVLIGGLGDDLLQGSWHPDTYIYNLGDGNDVIEEYASSTTGDRETGNRLELGAGITTANLLVTRDAADWSQVTLSFQGHAGSIFLKNQFLNSQWGVETIVFDDGTTWNMAQLTAAGLAQLTTDGDDYLFGHKGVDTIDGGAGNDQIFGWEGRDVLIGGLGDDLLQGSWHPDTYIYNLGDGNDVIYEYASSTTGDRETGNRLELGAGITTENIVVLRDVNDWQDVTLTFVGHDGSILLDEQFAGSKYGVETIAFADGTTTWNMTTLAALAGSEGDDSITGTDGANRLTGFAGNDTIDGGAGNDLLDGGAGADILTGGLDSDTFVFKNGDGGDTINDFETATGGDIVDVSAFGFADYAALSANFTQDGADTRIQLDADDTVTLVGINLADLQADHFLI